MGAQTISDWFSQELAGKSTDTFRVQIPLLLCITNFRSVADLKRLVEEILSTIGKTPSEVRALAIEESWLSAFLEDYIDSEVVGVTYNRAPIDEKTNPDGTLAEINFQLA